MNILPSAETRFDVALACDVELGEMVRNNPLVSTIDIDPVAVEAALHQLDDSEAGIKRSIVVLAAHDTTSVILDLEKAFSDLLPVNLRQAAGEPDKAPNTNASDLAKSVGENIQIVPIAIGGSSERLVANLEAEQEPRSALMVAQYALERSLDPEEIKANITEYAEAINHTYPTVSTDRTIQQTALQRLQMAVDEDNHKVIKSDQRREAIIEESKRVLFLGGIATAGLTGYAAAKGLTAEPVLPYVVEATAALTYMHIYIRHFNRYTERFLRKVLPFRSLQRIERAGKLDLPPVITVA